MTISYTLDVSQTDHQSLFRVMTRWRGSVWKAVLPQLGVWLAVYLLISLVYRFVLSEEHQKVFEHLAHYLNTGLDATIPLTFMLGFFVTFVVGRWGSILNGLGYIDNSAVNFATFIRGSDVETQILRRTLIRYMVLNQALVLRDISLQVRKRFPTLDTLVATGLITKEELELLDEVHDPYSRYWLPIHWCYSMLYEARLHGKIASDHLLEKITEEVQHFRHGLASLLKYDWVPIPLLYPQIIFLAVRLYFLICLISRQFITRPGAAHKSEIDVWIPITTVVQFIVYVGWMKVAEALLNPLGEDDDDLESNYVIDKNLITGLTLVDQSVRKNPDMTKDAFWDNDHITPLYAVDAAKRTVHPLIGSASIINLVKGRKTILMTPHKSKLAKMDEATQNSHIRVVDVEKHNVKFMNDKQQEKDADHKALMKIRKRHKDGKGLQHASTLPANFKHQTNGADSHKVIHGGRPLDAEYGGTPRPNTVWTKMSDSPTHQVHPERPSTQGTYEGGDGVPPRDYSPYMGHIRRTHPSNDVLEMDSRGGGLRRY